MNLLRKCLVMLWVSVLLSSVAYAAAPTAVDDSRTIPVNSSITLNLLANDFDADGDALVLARVASSANAEVVLNSDGSVFYTPNKDFKGIDTFTYTIEELGRTPALTATGTVTINVANSDFVEISSGENNRSLAVAMDVLCGNLRASSDSALGAGRRNLLERCNALDELALNDPAALNKAFNQIAPEETIALMRVTSESSRTQTAAVSQRVGQLLAGSAGNARNSFMLNGVASLSQPSGGGAGDAQPLWSALGLFASVQYEAAKRKVSNLEAGYDADGSAFTVGADYRFNNHWVMGAALGLSSSDLNYSFQNGSLDSRIASLIVFNSYSFDKLSLEAQLGYANTSFDSVRHLEFIESNTLFMDTLRGSTSGSQLLFNAQLQWDWNKNALTVSPFARFDYLQNNVDGYGESGSSGLPMIIGKQSTEQLTLGAGVQSTYVFNQAWGVFIPLFKIAMLSELSSGFDPVASRLAYDPDPANTFTLQNDGEDKSFSQIAIGSSFIFKGGVSGFFQYQQLVGYNHLSAHQIQGGLRYEF
jgi:outer membrane lipase/esterase